MRATVGTEGVEPNRLSECGAFAAGVLAAVVVVGCGPNGSGGDGSDRDAGEESNSADIRERDAGSRADGTVSDGGTTETSDGGVDVRTDRDGGGAEPVVHYGGGWPERAPAEREGWVEPETTDHREIGGGPMYGRKICSKPEGAVVVRSKSDLLTDRDVPEFYVVGDKKVDAEPGETIWIPGDATIDLSGESRIAVPSEVTIASDRGCDGSDGGLLAADRMPDDEGDFQPLFIAWGNGEGYGDDVRFTGLHIRGPVQGPDDAPVPSGKRSGGEDENSYIALAFWNASRAEVDNNRIHNFPKDGVSALTKVGRGHEPGVYYVHHNHITRQHRNGDGYNIAVTEGEALIEFNRLDYFRHAIATHGGCADAYEARYNVVGSHNVNHVIDVHGTCDADGDGEPDNSGKWYQIHHNTLGSTTDFSGNVQPAFWFDEGAQQPSRVYDNWIRGSRGRVAELGGGDPEVGQERLNDESAGAASKPNFDFDENLFQNEEPSCSVGAPRSTCESTSPEE